jgi:hypothetical protein
MTTFQTPASLPSSREDPQSPRDLCLNVRGHDKTRGNKEYRAWISAISGHERDNFSAQIFEKGSTQARCEDLCREDAAAEERYRAERSSMLAARKAGDQSQDLKWRDYADVHASTRQTLSEQPLPCVASRDPAERVSLDGCLSDSDAGHCVGLEDARLSSGDEQAVTCAMRSCAWVIPAMGGDLGPSNSAATRRMRGEKDSADQGRRRASGAPQRDGTRKANTQERRGRSHASPWEDDQALRAREHSRGNSAAVTAARSQATASAPDLKCRPFPSPPRRAAGISTTSVTSHRARSSSPACYRPAKSSHGSAVCGMPLPMQEEQTASISRQMVDTSPSPRVDAIQTLRTSASGSSWIIQIDTKPSAMGRQKVSLSRATTKRSHKVAAGTIHGLHSGKQDPHLLPKRSVSAPLKAGTRSVSLASAATGSRQRHVPQPGELLSEDDAHARPATADGPSPAQRKPPPGKRQATSQDCAQRRRWLEAMEKVNMLQAERRERIRIRSELERMKREACASHDDDVVGRVHVDASHAIDRDARGAGYEHLHNNERGTTTDCSIPAYGSASKESLDKSAGHHHDFEDHGDHTGHMRVRRLGHPSPGRASVHVQACNSHKAGAEVITLPADVADSHEGYAEQQDDRDTHSVARIVPYLRGAQGAGSNETKCRPFAEPNRAAVDHTAAHESPMRGRKQHERLERQGHRDAHENAQDKAQALGTLRQHDAPLVGGSAAAVDNLWSSQRREGPGLENNVPPSRRSLSTWQDTSMPWREPSRGRPKPRTWSEDLAAVDNREVGRNPCMIVDVGKVMM